MLENLALTILSIVSSVCRWIHQRLSLRSYHAASTAIGALPRRFETMIGSEFVDETVCLVYSPVRIAVRDGASKRRYRGPRGTTTFGA